MSCICIEQNDVSKRKLSASGSLCDQMTWIGAPTNIFELWNIEHLCLASEASEAAELCRPLHVQVFCRASLVLLLKPCCLAKTFSSVCRGDCKAVTVRHECFRKILQHGVRPSLLQCRSSSDTPLLAAAAAQDVRGQLPSCCNRLEPNERVAGPPENRLGRRQLSRVSSTCLAPGRWQTSKKALMRQSFLMTLRAERKILRC